MSGQSAPGETRAVSEAFLLIMELGLALGVNPVTQFAGCWEHRLGERWLVALNGHRTLVTTSTGAEVPPFHVYVERDGWPVGLLTPFGGTMLPGLEDELIAELQRRQGMP